MANRRSAMQPLRNQHQRLGLTGDRHATDIAQGSGEATSRNLPGQLSGHPRLRVPLRRSALTSQREAERRGHTLVSEGARPQGHPTGGLCSHVLQPRAVADAVSAALGVLQSAVDAAQRAFSLVQASRLSSPVLRSRTLTRLSPRAQCPVARAQFSVSFASDPAASLRAY